MNFCNALDQVASCHKANDFFTVFSSFALGGINNKTLNDSPPPGNSQFCFPLTSMFLFASPQETLRVSGKQNSLFPLVPAMKCLIATVHQGCLDYIHMYIGLFSYVKSIKDLIPFTSFSCSYCIK